jgi:hypothetical protein
MKQLIALLVLMELAVQTRAQVAGPPQHDPFAPDMWFGVNFSGSTNWPPEWDNFWGNGQYFRQYLSGNGLPLIITNRFEFEIVSPAMAQDAWLLEKEDDGSFTTITNLNLTGGPDVYYFGQAWNLTTNQIHSLITGNWYTEVDYANSNCVGNLTPRGWQGPFIGFPIAFGLHSLWDYYAISPDNRTAKVIFDGSHCEDEFYLPIECVWSAQAAGFPVPFTITNLMATNTFDIGFHTGTLQLSDGVVGSSPWSFPFEVITAGQAVDELIKALPIDGISSGQRQAMVRILSAAALNFNRRQMNQGCAQLETYKFFVEKMNLDNSTTTQLLQPAQEIINAFSGNRR